MSERWKIKDQHTLDSFADYASGRIKVGRPFTVELMKDGRSTEQNKFIHALFREVERQKGDETAEDVKRYVKLHFGVPLLRETNEKFRSRYDKVIKGSLSYEQKLEAMDLLPVTSELNMDQMSRLIDRTIEHFARQGVDLSNLGETP